jgi:methyl-accepting chemotaxis protein
VVADEVRALAQRSAAAARETSALLEGAVRETTAGAERARRVAAELGDLDARMAEVSESVAGIVQASAQQRDGVAQLTQTLGQLNLLTQGTAAAAEQSATAATELESQAATLRDTVATFRTGASVGSSPGARGAARARVPATAGQPLVAPTPAPDAAAPEAPAFRPERRRSVYLPN